MVDPPLDRIARSLAHGLPRRGLLAGLFAAMGGPLPLLPAGAGCKKIGRRCDKNQDCCDHADCKGGECKCQTGWKDCGDGTCVNRDTDENNCGHCGTVCAAGERCCTGACVDPRSDREHCGTCGHACDGGEDDLCRDSICLSDAL